MVYGAGRANEYLNGSELRYEPGEVKGLEVEVVVLGEHVSRGEYGSGVDVDANTDTELDGEL